MVSDRYGGAKYIVYVISVGSFCLYRVSRIKKKLVAGIRVRSSVWGMCVWVRCCRVRSARKMESVVVILYRFV